MFTPRFFATLLIAFACVLATTATWTATLYQIPAANHLAFEAEKNATLIAGTPTSWEPVDDAQASGGAALIADGLNDTTTAPHSFAQYQLKFATAGDYYLYYRWKADPARTAADVFTANSSWLPLTFGSFTTTGVDGQAAFYTSAANSTQAPQNNEYQWTTEGVSRVYAVTAADAASQVPLVFTLGTREAGMLIDRIAFSTDPSLSPAALDSLANAQSAVVDQNAGETHLSFEAERPGLTLIAGTPTSWEPINDTQASGGAALIAGGLNDTTTAPHSFAQYQLKFATAGDYYLYYRWKADPARTAADVFTANSSWLPLTFGSFTTTGVDGQASFYTSAANATQAPQNNEYQWTTEGVTRIYSVTAGDVGSTAPLVFTIGTREAGMLFDRIVLSTDPNLSPAALDALPNTGAQAAAPELVKANGSASLNQVTISFTRPLTPSSLAGAFSLSDGVSVSNATLDPTDARVVLLTTGPQTEGTQYTVTVTGATDTGGTPIAPGSTIQFTAWQRIDGWATRETYFGIPGSTVADLMAAPNFPDRPDRKEWVRGFRSFQDPLTDNYGARMTAFFHPAQNGFYEFYVNNDDEAELYMSSDASEANLEWIGFFPLKAPPFSEEEGAFAFSPISLSSSQRYLLQGLTKQGSGDVYFEVAARHESATTPPDQLTALSGTEISTMVNPDAGVVLFDAQPANVSASAGSRARFEVKVTTAERPVYFQWQADGVDIVGANRPVYVTPVLDTPDSGKSYRVVVSVAGRDSTSSEATLTVTPGDPSHLQPYIGINFVGGGGGGIGGTLTPFDVAGAVPQNNWNNLTGTSFDQVPLTDATGAVAPVQFTLQAAESWYCGTGSGDDANADGVLLQGYVNNLNAQEPMTLLLSGVPSGNYHLLVYSVGFPFQATYEQAYSLFGAETYPDYHVRGQTGLDYNADPRFIRMSSTDPNSRDFGNYVQFENVSPDTSGALTLTAFPESPTPGNNHLPAVNALQLVRVVAVTQRPTISANFSTPGTLTLGWGAAAANHVLETTPALIPDAVWTIVPGAPNPVAGAGTFDVQTTGDGAYYRLRSTN
jgi:hypothetical protein